MNDGVFGFIFGAVISGIGIYLATFITINSGWKDDCERIGFHLESSAEAKVYKCELVSKKSKP